jgi:type II secretory pathway pseudopilin PulG
MNALGVSALVFVCVFAGALSGIVLRRVLPKEHLSEEAKDVIKVTMAMIATLAALVLGLLTASAKTSLDEKENAVKSWAAQAILLDRTLAQYGPEAQEARDLLKETIAARMAQLWPGKGETVTPQMIGKGKGIEGVQQALLALTPKTDAQRWLQSTALQTTNTIAASRWMIAQQIASDLRWPFLIVLIFWLTVIFASFGLFAPNSTIVAAALFVAALSVTGSIFLILEMDQPYRGFITVRPDPLRGALDQLGQP